jgi:hypothetical protein
MPNASAFWFFLYFLRETAMRSVPRSTRLCVPALLAVLLAGCATPQERAAQKQAEVEQMMQVYGPACSRLGYNAGSDQWRACVLNLNAQDEMQRYGPSSYYPGYYPGRWRGGWW